MVVLYQKEANAYYTAKVQKLTELGMLPMADKSSQRYEVTKRVPLLLLYDHSTASDIDT